MSRLKKFLKRAAPVLSIVPGPVGTIARIATAASAARSVGAAISPSQSGVSPIMSIASSLPALPGVGRAIGTAVGAGRMIGAGAKRIASSAAAYCRRHPGWCQTIGGVGAIEAMIQRGELPPIKKSRSRGITAREFRSFKRVNRVISKYCAPVRRNQRAPAMRRKGTCQ